MYTNVYAVVLINPGEPGYEEYQKYLAMQQFAQLILIIINWPMKLMTEPSMINLIFIVLDFIWLYVLSCIIDFIYDKFRKKNKK